MHMDLTSEEKEYRWLDAAKLFEHMLRGRSNEMPFAAECIEKIAFSYSMASRQADSIEEFRKLRLKAADAYKKAATLFREKDSLESQAKTAECFFLEEYTRSWLAENSVEKAKLLDSCLAAGKNALPKFKNLGDILGSEKISVNLCFCLFDRLYVTATLEEKRRIVQEGINYAAGATSPPLKLECSDDLLTAFSIGSLLNWYAANISEEEDEQRGFIDESLKYSKEAAELSKKVDNAYSAATSMWAAALSNLYFTENIDASLGYAERMLEYASVTRDHYFKGIALYLLAHIKDWTVPAEADQSRKKMKYEEIIRNSREAINHLQIVSQDSAVAETYLFLAQSHSSLAREFALPPAEKLALSKEAVEIGEKGLEYAVRSGSPEAMGSTLHALSKAYHYSAHFTPKKDEKVQLLKRALDSRKDYISTVGRAFTSNFWTLGVGLVYAGQIEADLSKLETEPKNKIALLKEAVSSMEKGVSHCNRWIASRNVPSLTAIVAGFEDSYGALLDESYAQTEESDNLEKANKTYSDAAEKFKRVDFPSRVAELYWKIARNLDLCGEHQEASANFEKAFAGYKAAAQNIPQFSGFYLDYASYMKAWSEIQTAKLSHDNEDFTAAMKHYEKTSDLLKQSKLWSYLSPNFHAWAHLERAEDFSRKENSPEAINSFEEAINLCQESRRILSATLDKMDKIDEKDLVNRLIDASTARETYGHGRIEIEEARILDKKGDHRACSEKYGTAAATFRKMSLADSVQTRKEVEPLIYLCLAWQKMTLAEAKGSPRLYEEAAELFKLANEHSFNESAGLLALAHSYFCKALKSGTEFEATRNARLYFETKKHMDAAATYYLKAGFETDSEYAKATQRLFDAYVYIDNAKKETDPEKEAKYCLMAEKVLQISAESYSKANHLEKTDQVQKLLKKVREERELAVSLSEVLHAPAITSSTASFGTISLSEEKAVGLERFEHADLQAKLIQYGEANHVGEDVNIGIQIVNVGKEPLFLTKVENVLPDGFQLARKPDNCSFEDTQLLMKGDRLEPLKMDEIRLAFTPFRKVDAEIKPRIICVDETGRQMLFELEPKFLSISETVLPGRMSTGYEDLDSVLLGGIPENYAVVLASPSCDEREQLVKKFLETGARSGQTTYYITAETGDIASLTEEFQSNFYLFLCNPRADVMIKTLPNVYKLKGVENLTEIEIAVMKSFRSLDPSRTGPQRACITILSDILLQHNVLITRKWLSGLLQDLKSKGFTTLAVINPQMHPQEDVQAILGLFEGEIWVSESDTANHEQSLRIRKLYNQRYLENEVVLTKTRLNSE
jgi:hypothetical protein